jgi:hypothetical protein
MTFPGARDERRPSFLTGPEFRGSTLTDLNWDSPPCFKAFMVASKAFFISLGMGREGASFLFNWSFRIEEIGFWADGDAGASSPRAYPGE